MKTYHTTVEIGGIEKRVAVTYLLHKGIPGRYSGPPEQCYESEPAWVEFDAIKVDGISVEHLLTDQQITDLQTEIEDYEQAERDFAESEYWDAKRDEARFG